MLDGTVLPQKMSTSNSQNLWICHKGHYKREAEMRESEDVR